ncbi:glycosyl hydrolase family 95 catalytic domain-containing protein [Streptosporangium roseum]|uniref:glycosyl hydrolase family 95 catalytic domain-containing protein n=1 Tax=Streptosporangium roseum TaxID=2001 RepID=UPI0009DD561F
MNLTWPTCLETPPTGARTRTPRWPPPSTPPRPGASTQGDFSAGASMSQQIVFDVLTNSLEAARKLNVDCAFQTEVTAALARLDQGIRVGSWGQLQER